jgi:predicted ATPase
LEHAVHFAPDDTPAQKLDKVEAWLGQAGARVTEVAPLLAALLSLPTGDRYPPLALSPQRQKTLTIAALVERVVGLSRRQSVLCLVEDAHWCDPTTLEVLEQLVQRVPELRVLVIITSRPEFAVPWTASHTTALTLTRLGRAQVATMVEYLTAGKALPPEVLAHILDKTDGVPLFVEELTKTVLESGLLQNVGGRYALREPLPPLAIPATVQDSLMARLDRLAPVKAVAPLGAVLGREFAYEVLAAVPNCESALHDALEQLVGAGLLFRRGQPPEAHYRFKHALVQETAYASLLKSTRQQLHLQIATVLEAHFPAIAEMEPEVVARHYIEAGLPTQAIPYWQQAGERALARSANVEAIQHLTTGPGLLPAIPETPARDQQELALQIALGPALSAIKGAAAPEVERTYARARGLCAQLGETTRLLPTLQGLCRFYLNRGELATAQELGAQLQRLAPQAAAPMLRLEAYETLGMTWFFRGEYAAARTHLEHGVALIDPTAPRDLALHGSMALGVTSLVYTANSLWCLGYPAQAVRRCEEALALAHALAHPHSLAFAQHYAAFLHYRRRDVPAVHAQAEALLTLATDQGFPLWAGLGTCMRGWALAMQGQGEAGLVQLRQGLAAVVATGQGLSRAACLTLLAEAAGQAGHVEEGLRLLAAALASFEASGRGEGLAEAYRLQGELLLRQAVPDLTQADACFQQALAVAHRQQAKSWELRAAMSLSRLRQRQGQQAEARERLGPIYAWFTEGFETADLQEAKALLAAWQE